MISYHVYKGAWFNRTGVTSTLLEISEAFETIVCAFKVQDARNTSNIESKGEMTHRLSKNSSSTRSAKNRACGGYFLIPSAF